MNQTVSTLPTQTRYPQPAEKSSENRFWRLGFLVFVAAVIFAAHVPQLLRLGASMWSKEHYQFFPLVIVGAVYLAWVRRDLFAKRSDPSTALAWSNWVMTLLVFSGGVLLDSPWMAGFSALACLWSASYSLGGRVWLIHTLPVLFFLLLALPLPSEYDVKLITSLQRYVSQKASEIFDYLGYRHILDGVSLTFFQRTFQVDQACSGIHSFFASLCCASFYLAVTRRSFFRYLYLIPAAVFWVIVANVLRVLLVCLLSMEWDLPVVEGTGHTLFGAFVFVFAIGMIFSTDRLLLFVLPLRASEGVSVSSSNAPAGTIKFPRLHLGTLVASVLLMVCFGFLGGLSVVRGDLLSRNLNLALGEDDFFSLPKESLPEEWNGWILGDYKVEKRDISNPMGAYSQVWTYYKEGKVCLFSVDSPFPAWHDLAVCYQNIGWTLLDQQDLADPEGSAYHGERTELSLRRDGEGYQYVIFSAIDSEQKPVPVPKLYRVSVTRRFMEEIEMLSANVGLDQRSATPPICQMQLVVKSRTPMSELQMEQCRQLFVHLRSLTRRQARRGPITEISGE